MANEYRVIVPRTDNSGNPIKPESYDPYFQQIITRFGGITIHPKLYGCWFNADQQRTECDEVMMVMATRLEKQSKSENKADRDFFNQVVKDIGHKTGQGAMYSSKMHCDANLTFCEWRSVADPNFYTPAASNVSGLIKIEKKRLARGL